MRATSRLRVDPGTLELPRAGSFEVAIPYTEPDLARAALEFAAVLAHGLEARMQLLAVYAAPYPAPLGCPSAVNSFLVERLVELCRKSPVPAGASIVVARSVFEGYQRALKPESVVLIAAAKRLWRTREERLARALAAAGHHVTLMHLR